jgi:hypothetical protein
MPVFSKWRAPRAPASSPKPTVVFDQVLRYNRALEAIAARYDIHRDGDDDGELIRRTAFAIQQSIARQSQVVAALQRDLDLVLGFED